MIIIKIQYSIKSFSRPPRTNGLSLNAIIAIVQNIRTYVCMYVYVAYVCGYAKVPIHDHHMFSVDGNCDTTHVTVGT